MKRRALDVGWYAALAKMHQYEKNCELYRSVFCMILTISSFDRLGSVMEAGHVYCVVMYTNFWHQRANQKRLRN
jgi:hypothetical protein